MPLLTWSDDRVEQLRKLWENGLGASQIARELGNVTRNAVIGKVHRLGLSGRAKSPLSGAPKQHQAKHIMRVSFNATAAPKRNSGPPTLKTTPLPEEEVMPESQRITFQQLSDEICHWPTGDFFCGNPTRKKPGDRRPSYCPQHDWVAHAQHR